MDVDACETSHMCEIGERLAAARQLPPAADGRAGLARIQIASGCRPVSPCQ